MMLNQQLFLPFNLGLTAVKSDLQVQVQVPVFIDTLAA